MPFRSKNKWALPVSSGITLCVSKPYSHSTPVQPINPRLFLTLAVRQLEEAKKLEATPEYQDTVKAYKILLSLVKYINVLIVPPHTLTCSNLPAIQGLH